MTARSRAPHSGNPRMLPRAGSAHVALHPDERWSWTRRQVVGAAVGALLAPDSGDGREARSARFEIVGPELRHAGVPVRLLGVAVGDPIYVRDGRPQSDYQVIAQVWGANTVRISLHPGHWRADRHRALKRLGADIAAARRAGLFVIVDWHVIGYPGRYTERPDPAWGLPEDAYDPDLDLAMEFWAEMAESFGRDPGIIFELWNEPVPDPKLWVSTGEHWPLLRTLWLRLIEVIRRRSDAIVLATGGRFAHDLKGVAQNLIEDPRVAYAWHCYPPQEKDHPGGWFDTLGGLQRVRPVVVTEWGFCRDCVKFIRGTPQDFGVPFARDVLEGLNLHWTAWCWSAGATPRMLEADWTSATEFGRFVRGCLDTAKRPPT